MSRGPVVVVSWALNLALVVGFLLLSSSARDAEDRVEEAERLCTDQVAESASADGLEVTSVSGSTVTVSGTYFDGNDRQPLELDCRVDYVDDGAELVQVEQP